MNSKRRVSSKANWRASANWKARAKCEVEGESELEAEGELEGELEGESELEARRGTEAKARANSKLEGRTGRARTRRAIPRQHPRRLFGEGEGELGELEFEHEQGEQFFKGAFRGIRATGTPRRADVEECGPHRRAYRRQGCRRLLWRPRRRDARFQAGPVGCVPIARAGNGGRARTGANLSWASMNSANTSWASTRSLTN